MKSAVFTAIIVSISFCVEAFAAGPSSSQSVRGVVPPPLGHEASRQWYLNQYADPAIFTSIGPPGDPGDAEVSPDGQLFSGAIVPPSKAGRLVGNTIYCRQALAFALLYGGQILPVGSGQRAKQSFVDG
ncbi:MAG TPA: hypothetical protein VGY56_08790 [Verrucomicrobiae bacterium]|nr:hypothetical protein [Verrucomicrobiae bacterium]